MADAAGTLAFQSALAAYRRQDYPTAAQLCQRILRSQRNDQSATMLLVEIARATDNPKEELEYLRQAIRQTPKDGRVRERLGHHYSFNGHFTKAIAQFEKALKLEPTLPGAISGIARALELQHKVDRARRLLEPHVRRGNADTQILAVYIRLLVNAGDLEEAIRHGEILRARDEPTTIARRESFYQLARAYERTEDYDSAFEVATLANAMLASTFDPEAYREYVDIMIATVAPELLAATPRPAEPSDLPVFIVGTPRCGSTLVERIIDTHPAAYGAGEVRTMLSITREMSIRIGSTRPYPGCIADLDQDGVEMLSRSYLDEMQTLARSARRISNKDLGNVQHLGIINVLFPAGRVIHCRRNPVDTCLSCYMQAFGPNTAPFANDLTHLGLYYRQYERLMRHWAEVLDIARLDVDYEELVADQETVSRRIIDFCALPWHDACLRFHETKRQDRTLSYDQVRKPIYDSSVGRAERFGALLDPLRTALAGS